MNTSYFANKKLKGLRTISIAMSKPDFYKGPEYRKLAPPSWILYRYREDHNEEWYIKKYKELVLDILDPKAVYEDLGDDVVMLCWEKSGSFCHRRIVADWFAENLNVTVEEL